VKYNLREFNADFHRAPQGHQIRRLMDGGGNLLAGIIEADETYVGGVRRKGFGRGAVGKIPIVGVVARRGEVRATVVTNATAGNAIGHLRTNVETTAQVVSDESPIYNFTSKFSRTALTDSMPAKAAGETSI
jgi:hypothetical protein